MYLKWNGCGRGGGNDGVVLLLSDHIPFRVLKECSADRGCFHTTAKCVFWIVIRNAHLESRFEIRYFGPCVRQKHRESWFEMRISNHVSDVFWSYASQITILDVFWRTHSQNTVFWIVIQDAHLESRFKIRTLPSCENSQRRRSWGGKHIVLPPQLIWHLEKFLRCNM